MYNLKTPILIFSSSFLKITLDIICQLKNSGLTLTCIGKKNIKIGTEILVHLEELNPIGALKISLDMILKALRFGTTGIIN